MSTFSRAVVPSLIACFLLASGCDTGNPSGPGDDPEQSTESPCEFTDAAALDLQIGTSFYSVEDPIRAVVYEHAQPNMYEVIAEAGNCRHIVLAPPFCAPPGTYLPRRVRLSRRPAAVSVKTEIHAMRAVDPSFKPIHAMTTTGNNPKRTICFTLLCRVM